MLTGPGISVPRGLERMDGWMDGWMDHLLTVPMRGAQDARGTEDAREEGGHRDTQFDDVRLTMVMSWSREWLLEIAGVSKLQRASSWWHVGVSSFFFSK